VRILFAPHGTRGDIQPLVPIALALERRGHQVRFVAPDNAVPWVRALGLSCVSNGVDVEASVRAIESSTAGLRRYVRQKGREAASHLFESVAGASADADLLVSSGIPLAAASVAEARGIPHVYAMFCPGALPNREGPPPVVSCQTLPRWMNALLWRATLPLADFAVRAATRTGRARLGLAPTRASTLRLMGTHIIVAADPELAPQTARLPAGGIRTDPWVLRDARAIDSRVDAFIRSGPPPVYVGFGSMVARPSLGLGRSIVEAARLTGRRIIVAGGWAEFEGQLAESDRLLTIAEASHQTLFPLMAAVVHHGGAGTTTAAARAGVPQVIVPHLLDQFYWARRVEVLGLGPAHLKLGAVTPETLAEKIAAVTAPAFAAQATAFGSRAAGRDGVIPAVEYVESLPNK
jgi:vancomycin aglycone glucosyltransferase